MTRGVRDDAIAATTAVPPRQWEKDPELEDPDIDRLGGVEESEYPADQKSTGQAVPKAMRLVKTIAKPSATLLKSSVRRRSTSRVSGRRTKVQSATTAAISPMTTKTSRHDPTSRMSCPTAGMKIGTRRKIANNSDMMSAIALPL